MILACIYIASIVGATHWFIEMQVRHPLKPVFWYEKVVVITPIVNTILCLYFYYELVKERLND